MCPEALEAIRRFNVGHVVAYGSDEVTAKAARNDKSLIRFAGLVQSGTVRDGRVLFRCTLAMMRTALREIDSSTPKCYTAYSLVSTLRFKDYSRLVTLGVRASHAWMRALTEMRIATGT